MNKYFIEILKIKNSVIIPGLGSLMITNPKTGKIVLSPHLKFDDGTLVNFIAEKEGIDKAEAKNKVSKFVREIEAELDKGESYDIYQFGKITKNEKGEPTFDMDPSLLKEGAIIAPKVADVKPVVDVKKDEVSEIKENKPKNVYIPPVETKIEKTEEKIDKKVEEVKAEKKPTIKEDKALKVKEEKAKLAEKNKQDKAKKEEEKKAAKLKLAQDKKDKVKSKKESKVPKEGEEKKKKRRLAPLILLFITLGALAFGAYVFKDDIKASFGMTDGDSHDPEGHEEDGQQDTEDTSVIPEESSELESDTLNTETVAEEEVIEEEPIVEEVVQQKPVNTNVSGGYHIIGGGFSEESNATNYASKVGGTVLGRFDKLYLVAIKSYDSMSDAKADLSNVQSTSASAWIFKYSK